MARLLDSESGCVRAGDERGFTMIELVVVLLILGLLMTVAVGSYIGMRDRGEASAAELKLREGLTAAELFYAHNETYTGMTLADLQSFDAGLRLSEEPVIAADGRRFCLESTHNGRSTTAGTNPGHSTHRLIGPGGDPYAGPCPSSL